MRWQPKPCRGWLIALLLFTVCLAHGTNVASATAIGEEVRIAGIVVEHGDGQVSYALVPFTEDTISGMELLDRSELALVTVVFGGMGKGVCAIEETGCEPSACRARLCQTGDPESPFWHYLRQPVSEDWQIAALGASSSKVQDGDVDGWFWTGKNPDPDRISVDFIAAELGVDLDGLNDLEPVSATTGGSGRDRDEGTTWEVFGGVALIGGVAGLGGLALYRSRRQRTG